MKINLSVLAVKYKEYIVLKEIDRAGRELIERFLKKKDEWEQRNKKEFFVEATLELKYQKRTYKQNNSVWKLVTAIFESQENRLPCEAEKKELYLDLLEEYADKTPSRISGKLRPVHISESNSMEGARFIDGLIYHLARYCDLNYDAQSSVIGILQDWHEWRGELEIDPLDYSDLACTKLLTDSEWRDKHKISEASGKGGDIILHHIITRGSNKAAEDIAWNWLALLNDEHKALHDKGDDYFLRVYPHLKGKFNRARKLANLLKR